VKPAIFVKIIFINFLARIIYNFRRTDIFTRSGSLAFTILLSFIPFTISMVSIISWLPISNRSIIKIQHHVFMNYVPPDAGEQIYHQVKIFLHQSHHLSILGFIFLLITTYLMIFAIEKQLNAIWHNRRHGNFGKSLLRYTLFLLCGLFLTAAVSILQFSSFLEFSSEILAILNRITSALITIFLFILVYKMLPHHKAAFKHAFIASVVATIIFFLIKELFMHVLVKIFANYHIIYGSLSFVPIFLLWIYLSCLNLFFCAGIIYALETKFNRKLQHRVNGYLQLKFGQPNPKKRIGNKK
jgi:membrane protein